MACNFKYVFEKNDKIYCCLKQVGGSAGICDGEDNCILFKKG